MRSSRLFAVFAVSSLLVSAACGGTPEDRPDSAVDAATPDAALDASRPDGAVDAGSDGAVLADAGDDAALPELDAGDDAALPDVDAGCTSSAACEDGDPCTLDTCDSGTCNSVPVDPDDGDPCTVDGCDPVVGVTHTAVLTDDSDVCTVDGCDPVTGVTHTAVFTDDSDACTVDSCDPVTGVAHTPVSVDDSNACTADSCAPATGIAHTPVSVDDSNACTADSCAPLTGIAHTPVSVDDSNACTTDSCAPATGIAHTPVSVDDGSVCTVDSCDPTTGVAHTPVSVDDSNGCTTDSCDATTGVAHTPVSVDDSNACTLDSCAPATGAVTNLPLTLGTPCSQGLGVVCDGLGACVAYPAVASTTPADATSAVATTSLAVTFTTAMRPTTLTAQTVAGACTGSVQVSLDNFATCIALASASPVMSGGDTVATLTAAPGLLVNRTYQIRVTTAAAGATGLPLAAQFTTPLGFITGSPDLCAGSVVIAQVYGAGGNAGALVRNDYVVLHNRGAAPASLAGWSLQYASATGTTTWLRVANLVGTIPSGGYYLVQGASGGAVGTVLPGSDQTSAVDMAGAAGKVALVANTTLLSTQCPTGASILDFVGYGTTANCFEGAARTPVPSATLAVFRAQTACADVNNNGADFAVAAPAPLYSASPVAACACAALDESGVAAEADYCNVQFPLSLSLAAGAASGNVFGQLYELGTTEAAGSSSAVRAQLGFGPPTANPEYEAGWSWTNATYNVQVGANDEYQASFTAPGSGSYRYAYRFSLDSGVSWTVCDQNAGDGGAGSNAGLTFDLASLPVLTVP